MGVLNGYKHILLLVAYAKSWVDHLVALRVGKVTVFRHLGHYLKEIFEFWVVS